MNALRIHCIVPSIFYLRVREGKTMFEQPLHVQTFVWLQIQLYIWKSVAAQRLLRLKWLVFYVRFAGEKTHKAVEGHRILYTPPGAFHPPSCIPATLPPISEAYLTNNISSFYIHIGKHVYLLTLLLSRQLWNKCSGVSNFLPANISSCRKGETIKT